MTLPAIHLLAEGFRRGGLEFCYSYPGFHANELHDALHAGPFSINERTAWAQAWGSALAGRRTLAAFKNVGLNDAADPFLSSIQLGCFGGLVLALFEDCDIQHSQNRMDSRHYFDLCGGLWLEPRTLHEAIKLASESFALSERFSTPVVMRLTNILLNRAGGATVVDFPSQQRADREFSRNPARWVAHPSNAAAQEKGRFSRNRAVEEFVETLFEDEILSEASCDDAFSAVTFGPWRNIDPERALNLYTLPLPKHGIRRLGHRLKKVRVYEHGSPFIDEKLRGVLSSIDAVPCVMNEQRVQFRYHNAETHEPLFSLLRAVRDRVIIGDLGEFTMDPHQTIDACLCYGASVAVGAGFARADSRRRVLVVCGDAAFAHSGLTAMEQAVAEGIGIDVIVLDNGGARSTGGQTIAGGWPTLLHRRDISVTVVDPQSSLDLLETSLRTAPTAPRLFVVKTHSWRP